MIIIDPGHGGTDPGSVNKDIFEKDLTLMISQYQQRRFEELGIDPKLTRINDETLDPDERIERVEQISDINDKLLISNHINAGGGTGFEIYYSLRGTDTLPNQIIQDVEDAGFKTRGIKQRPSTRNPNVDYYFMLRETAPLESLIIEYGFIDNEEDLNILLNNWQPLAEAVVKSITEYLGYEYTPPTGMQMYIVQPGDSLSEIARDFNTTVEEIKLLNNLTSDFIRVGDSLIIPGVETPEVMYKEYVVQPGDVISRIAVENGVTTQEIIELNNLTSDVIFPGQILLIPTKSMRMDIYDEYVVKSGDTVSEIARDFGTTTEELLRINNLTSSLIFPGQILLVPKATNVVSNNMTFIFEYIVRPNDSLSSIAKRYRTTVKDLKEMNGLKSDLIYINQPLLVPYTTL